MAPLKVAVKLVNVKSSAPPSLVKFVLAAAERGDSLHPYYGIQRLARCLFKPGEDLSAAAMNSINCRFKGVLNVFRAMHFPASEPLFQQLDGLHKPYQVL
jgi:hypothetical protein